MKSENRHLDPALYIHIPFCTRKCPYCGFYSEPLERHNPHLLVGALIREITSRQIGPHVKTIYIGGGSPACLPSESLAGLLSFLARTFSPPTEVTLEINPGQITPDLLALLRDSGVNRLSIGAQSFRQQDLELLQRPYQTSQIYQSIDQARRAGFRNLSLDLIFALPGSTPEHWEAVLQAALDTGVEHISAYSLSWEPGTLFHRRRETGSLIPLPEETDRQMYERTIDLLTRAGWDHYEISNFARPGFTCRHNLSYWHNDPWIGIGPAAASWYEGTRSSNLADIPRYIDSLKAGRLPLAESHTPTPAEVACETAVLMLRLTEGIDLKEYRRKTGCDLLSLFPTAIRHHTAAGMLKQTPGRLALTRDALPVADAVLCDFAAPDG